MPFTVQLDLDAATEAGLCELADRLGAISDLETVRQLGDVHHVSLAVYDDLALDSFLPRLIEFAGSVRTLTLRMANIGIFPGARSVLFLSPVASEELLALHRGFHDSFAAFSGSCWEHYRPAAFVPHVTLAMNATPEALQRAVAVVVEGWKPAATRLDAVRLIEFRPVRTLYHRSL
jgi:2'-5' RNA ligase